MPGRLSPEKQEMTKFPTTKFVIGEHLPFLLPPSGCAASIQHQRSTISFSSIGIDGAVRIPDCCRRLPDAEMQRVQHRASPPRATP